MASFEVAGSASFLDRHAQSSRRRREKTCCNHCFRRAPSMAESPTLEFSPTWVIIYTVTSALSYVKKPCAAVANPPFCPRADDSPVQVASCAGSVAALLRHADIASI